MPEETTVAEQSVGEPELEPVDPIIGKVADIGLFTDEGVEVVGASLPG
ncbi:Uncharacterised protein [Mycobacteroides abscessus]|nr:hypothetical protein [Mycobacteroides abscessus]CPR31285.1 Uncharacterised protein [Mycobacteroides abscessus]CPR66931.1 Uncharacterised protein [Mycobacteroides abscessus]CPS34157.1 Uncharacterised protein [Mycobacteroides abscessus]CPS61755.1 Uncharacterised protein [Mycobacteroides abscessus]CPS83962.1 Uncharacterised protein [Mycobacteroides abscessus]